MAIGFDYVRFEKVGTKEYQVLDNSSGQVLGIVLTNEDGWGLIKGNPDKYWNRKTAGEALLIQKDSGVLPRPAASGPGFFQPTPFDRFLQSLQDRLTEIATEKANPVKGETSQDYLDGRIDELTFLLVELKKFN